ncbi:MAG TPA: glycosyltransferase [Ramlibacter sp.]|uniref:glycosyltransferase n=1 Tax=Ramlibacter sp. TaxID=1917967 RepID=UPI002C5805B2|nr:glycosyltransferase [Ramlibacter sp.]HVZ46075.1 glycosyltransferase [Ramlibacter sp.]
MDDRVVIVTPVYEDAAAATQLLRELAKELGPSVHVIAVDDGSVHEPLSTQPMIDAGIEGTVVTLRRNVGHQRAIAVGLAYAVEHFAARASSFVTMDSDGEDLPRTVLPLLDALAPDDVDVVVAQRRSRVETLRFRIFYQVYKRVFRLLTGRWISFGNFMAMKPAAARRLVGMEETWVHVASSVLASKLRIAGCPLDRGPRYAGRSKLNFIGLALHGFRGLMVFAEDVLVRVGVACALLAGASMLGATTALVLKLAGLATPGWFSMVVGILLVVFLQTGTLTLTMLMLTGLVRRGGGGPADHVGLIDRVAHARLVRQEPVAR